MMPPTFSPRTLALLVSDMRFAFIQELTRGVSQEAGRAGLDLAILTCLESTRQAAALDSLRHSAVAGVIAVLGETSAVEQKTDAGWAQLSAVMPVVLIDDREVAADAVCVVAATNHEGAYAATQHLIELGHTRIATLTGPLDVANARERLAGYVDARRAAGLPHDASLVRRGDYSYDDAHAQARELLAAPARPTAFFCANDAQAYGVIDAACEMGLGVPHDLSVVGFDDLTTPLGPYPWLTSVRQPLYEMGCAAAQIILALLQGKPDVARRQLVPTTLVIRGSTWTLAPEPVENF